MSKVRAIGAVAAVAVFFGGVWSKPWGPEWLFRAVEVVAASAAAQFGEPFDAVD